MYKVVMSRDMRQNKKVTVRHEKIRSAHASAQSDQSFRRPHSEG